MTHAEFVAAYRAGHVRVHVDRDKAARFISARLMLPFFLLPVLGAAVALALLGWLVAGILVFLAALGLRWLVRSSGQGFVLARALEHPAFYEECRAGGLLAIEAARDAG